MKRVFIQTPIGHEVQWIHDVIYVHGKEPLEIVRGFSVAIMVDGKYAGYAQFFELPNGDFVYNNGEPVTDREHLLEFPEPHKSRALAWFDLREQKKMETGKEPGEKGPEPKQKRPPRFGGVQASPLLLEEKELREEDGSKDMSEV